jgi:hypothetical protein
MLERLGNILYWLGCGLATLITALGVYLGFDENTGAGRGWMVFAFCAVVAILFWLVGRGCRYLFSGK